MKTKYLYILSLFSVVGCSSFKEKVGLMRPVPNEFETIKSDSLIVPRSTKIVHPSLAEGKKEKSVADQARDILGLRPSKPKGLHQAEANLLGRIAANKRDPKIKYKIDHDTKEETIHDKVQNALVFWKKSKKGDVIDPQKEQKKLKESEKA